MRGADGMSEAARALYHRERTKLDCQVDRLFAVLMGVQWAGAIIAALVLSPRAWDGAHSSVHAHVFAAFLVGGLLAAPVMYLVRTRAGDPLTRRSISIAQVLFSTLLIHLMGGRIETHFHVFGSLAFLALYRDWRLLIAPMLLVFVDHTLRGAFWPRSVFGVSIASPFRSLEHTGWVLFEGSVLAYGCLLSSRQLRATCAAQAALTDAIDHTEAVVEVRTRELEHARRCAESASRAKSDFLANVSHELRTPMTAILGFAELLQEGEEVDPKSPDRLDAARTIRVNASHLLTIINDFLDMSKIEAGKMSVERIDTDPALIIEEVASLLRPRATGKGIGLRVEYESAMPRRIASDPTRLRQIILNLVNNAIKFTEAGDVVLSAHCDATTGLLRVSVRDSGIGMSPEQVEAISKFEAFAQADGSMTRRFGGTGLGLRISNTLAQLLGGEITIESEAGKGSVFTASVGTGDLHGVEFMLPERVPEDVGERRQEEERSEREAQGPTPLAGMDILLAEDGLDNQRLIRFHLERAGARATIANNGREALECVDARKDAPFDVILMDMQMPELDGYQATRRLRAQGLATPIIALTAHSMMGDREKCLQAGCTEYLTKPIDTRALIRLCRAHGADTHLGSPAESM